VLVEVCLMTQYRLIFCFFFSSRRRHTRSKRDWSSDVCSSDLDGQTNSIKLESENDLELTGKYIAHELCDIIHLEGAEALAYYQRSEERRVGKECRSRWGADQ